MQARIRTPALHPYQVPPPPLWRLEVSANPLLVACSQLSETLEVLGQIVTRKRQMNENFDIFELALRRYAAAGRVEQWN
jgi:hypothetical protein